MLRVRDFEGLLVGGCLIDPVSKPQILCEGFFFPNVALVIR